MREQFEFLPPSLIRFNTVYCVILATLITICVGMELAYWATPLAPLWLCIT